MSVGKKILMTGGGAPGAAGIIRMIRAAGAHHLTAADAREQVVGKCLAEDFVRIPPATHPEFAEALYEACRRRHIDFVLPLVTRELEPLFRHRAQFERAGITLLLAGEALQIANDKAELHRFLLGEVFIPEFYTCTDAQALRAACVQLGYPERAVCFKPAVSNGSRGFRILDPNQDRFRSLFQEKPDAAYTTLEEMMSILGGRIFPELLVAPFFPGVEFSVDALAIHGKPVVVLPRRRLRTVGGITAEGIFEREPALIRYTEQIIARLNLHGTIGLQFRAASNGQFYLLEINPRVQGTLVAALGAGVNPVGMLLQYYIEGRVDFDPDKVKWGTHFIRFWDEVFLSE